MKKDKIAIVILSVALLISSSIIISTRINGNNESAYESAVNEIVEIDYSERQEKLDQIVEDGMINIQYSLSASFDGKISTNFNVKNIKNNKHPIKFILFDENGEEIYKSKKIDLGYEINSIELDKELSSGVHEGHIQIGYDEEGNVSSIFPITLQVK